jgi:hypothetical protein
MDLMFQEGQVSWREELDGDSAQQGREWLKGQ